MFVCFFCLFFFWGGICKTILLGLSYEAEKKAKKHKQKQKPPPPKTPTRRENKKKPFYDFIVLVFHSVDLAPSYSGLAIGRRYRAQGIRVVVSTIGLHHHLQSQLGRRRWGGGGESHCVKYPLQGARCHPMKTCTLTFFLSQIERSQVSRTTFYCRKCFNPLIMMPLKLICADFFLHKNVAESQAFLTRLR